jgi:hypothetical protein
VALDLPSEDADVPTRRQRDGAKTVRERLDDRQCRGADGSRGSEDGE